MTKPVMQNYVPLDLSCRDVGQAAEATEAA